MYLVKILYQLLSKKIYIYIKDHRPYTYELKPIKNLIKRNKIVKLL